MTTKPRQTYEAVSLHVGLLSDGTGAVVLVDTNGPVDLSLRLSRDTLEQLVAQVAAAQANQAAHADPKKAK